MTDEQFAERARQLCQNKPAPAPDPIATAESMMAMVAAKAEAGAQRENEYMGPDGLMRCRVCDGKRETIVTLPFEGAQPRKVRCWCKCPNIHAVAAEREKQVKLEQRLAVCFRGVEEMKGCTFGTDDGAGDPRLIQAAQRYAADFRQHLRDGMGLLYHGPVGTGKTFLAACIANDVIAQGYRVRLTSFARVADEIFKAENKAEYIDHLCRYDLLILDDLGVERKTEYMQEMVYKIVNARYVAGAPVIVTTNLTPDELTKTADIGYTRTYDRLLEKCLPIKVDGPSRRRAAAKATWGAMRQQLGLEV